MKSIFLTIKDVAQYCRVSQFTVLRWVQQGKLGAYKTGDGQVLVPLHEFQFFLRASGMPVDGLYFRAKGNQKRILVICEDDDLTEFLARSLCQASVVVRVFSAHNWQEARCQAMALKPDLIILGPTHLDSDGSEIRQWLKQHSAFEHTKLLAIVDANEAGQSPPFADKAVDAIIQQPLDAATVQKKVYTLLTDT